MSLEQGRAVALAAAVDALWSVGDLEHARSFFVELRELLGRPWVGYMTPEHRDLKPENLVLEEEPGNPPAGALTSPVATSPAPARAMTPAERSAAYRARKRGASRASAPQLPLVTPVTRRHAAAVTSVTPSVTRDVTPSVSSLSSSPRLPKSLGEERELSLENKSAVTRDVVTAVTLPEVLDGPLRAVFDQELANRPGVELDAEALWRKLRRKFPVVSSVTELRNRWRKFCRTEWPTPETSSRQLPLSPPRREVEKGEPIAPPASGPTVRSAPVDDEERSRRLEREARDRRAREDEAVRREISDSGIRDLVTTKLGDMFTPEAMAAARAAVLEAARKAS